MKENMTVLVCGGRNLDKSLEEIERLHGVLSSIHTKYNIIKIIHGGATGADSAAGDWAINNQIRYEVFPAQWNKYNRSAGVIRNRQMAIEGNLDLVLAFPGGHGTAHMVKAAQTAKIETATLELLGEQ